MQISLLNTNSKSVGNTLKNNNVQPSRTALSFQGGTTTVSDIIDVAVKKFQLDFSKSLGNKKKLPALELLERLKEQPAAVQLRFLFSPIDGAKNTPFINAVRNSRPDVARAILEMFQKFGTDIQRTFLGAKEGHWYSNYNHAASKYPKLTMKLVQMAQKHAPDILSQWHLPIEVQHNPEFVKVIQGVLADSRIGKTAKKTILARCQEVLPNIDKLFS